LRKYKLWLGLAVFLCFATAGIAVASEEPSAQTQAVAASFQADMKREKSGMCKGADGTYKVTHSIYWGVAESTNPLLDGRMRLKLESFYNVDEKLGKVAGELHIRNEDTDTRAVARLVGVNSNGDVEGILIGVAGRPHAKLVANFSARLGESAIAGKLGDGSSSNLAVLFSRGCKHREHETTALARDQGKQERGEEHPEKKDRPSESSGK
jgi:hypothetical protein